MAAAGLDAGWAGDHGLDSSGGGYRDLDTAASRFIPVVCAVSASNCRGLTSRASAGWGTATGSLGME